MNMSAPQATTLINQLITADIYRFHFHLKFPAYSNEDYKLRLVGLNLAKSFVVIVLTSHVFPRELGMLKKLFGFDSIF